MGFWLLIESQRLSNKVVLTLGYDSLVLRKEIQQEQWTYCAKFNSQYTNFP